MPNEVGLAEVLSTVRDRIESLSGQAIGEQNTKAGLIAPVLRALGWDVEDLREVHLEYRRRPADKPVDYALLISGQPRMFVEAKALGENLEDSRWANQIMGYALVAGVRWVVLTNGDEYRVYNTHASVPVEEKLFRKVRVTAPSSSVEETLALLSKESIAELEALWEEDFVDRQVQTAFDALLEPEPDAALVRLLKRRLPGLKPGQIRMALVRLRQRERRKPPPEPKKPKPPPKEPPQGPGEGTPWRAVTLGDILSAGLLRPPVDLFRRYKGNELKARIEADGRVSFGGRVYGSLSVAGMMARRSIIGQDQRAQTNGWTFWKYRDESGALQEIDHLRQRLYESRKSG